MSLIIPSSEVPYWLINRSPLQLYLTFGAIYSSQVSHALNFFRKQILKLNFEAFFITKIKKSHLIFKFNKCQFGRLGPKPPRFAYKPIIIFSSTWWSPNIKPARRLKGPNRPNVGIGFVVGFLCGNVWKGNEVIYRSRWLFENENTKNIVNIMFGNFNSRLVQIYRSPSL